MKEYKIATSIDMKSYSILFPLYNEEEILESHTLRVYKYLEKKKYNFELILVNDSSTDNSLKIANQLAKKYSKIRVISYSNGPSRRENLFASFREATGDIIAFTDLDLAVDEKYFEKLFAGVNKSDICIASRYDFGAKMYREWWRGLISIIYLKTIQFLFNCPISDFQCGFKAFRKEILLPLLDECGYDEKFTRGWFLDAELLIRAFKRGNKVVSIPVVWNRGKMSSFNFLREAKIIPYVIAFWWKLKST